MVFRKMDVCMSYIHFLNIFLFNLLNRWLTSLISLSNTLLQQNLAPSGYVKIPIVSIVLDFFQVHFVCYYIFMKIGFQSSNISAMHICILDSIVYTAKSVRKLWLIEFATENKIGRCM